MPGFIPGLQLSGLYYQETVKPILEAVFPHLVYSASLIGPGSEVLGYDNRNQWITKKWQALFLEERERRVTASPAPTLHNESACQARVV